jgi:hypothetical protein
MRGLDAFSAAFEPFQFSVILDIEILVTLSYGEGCIGTEDLGEEDIVGDVFGFELVATDGAVGASEVAWFPREVEGAEGGGNVLWELGQRSSVLPL